MNATLDASRLDLALAPLSSEAAPLLADSIGTERVKAVRLTGAVVALRLKHEEPGRPWRLSELPHAPGAAPPTRRERVGRRDRDVARHESESAFGHACKRVTGTRAALVETQPWLNAASGGTG